MNIYISQLILEITRKCNMHCAHCLRGDAENLDMSEEILTKTIDSICSIGNVCFTGGEPSLNLPLMDFFLDEMSRKKKVFDAFEIVTNGKEHQLDLGNWCLRAFSRCDQPDMCYLAMSRDVYHDPVKENIFKAFSFYSSDKEFKTKEDRNRHLIAEGRGAEIEGSIERKFCGPTLDFWEDTISVETLYVTATGDILFDCDMSFEHGKNLSYGNILKEPLEEILVRVNKLKEEK